MKSASFAVAVLALAAPFAMAQSSTTTWKSDPAHSEVDFTIKHLAVSNVHGRLGHVDATVSYDEKDITVLLGSAATGQALPPTSRSGRQQAEAPLLSPCIRNRNE